MNSRGNRLDTLSEGEDEALRACLDSLAAPDAALSIERDPYWPKWDSPWWKLALLREAGTLERAPVEVVRALGRAADRRWLHHFPIEEGELPPGKDPHRDVACHCALGTLYRILGTAGLDVDREHPWMREWFLRYQIEDGGLNCDEAAYRKSPPRSSFLSTLPPLEAVLFHTARELAPPELEFLRRGAGYLLDRRLCRSRRDPSRWIDRRWLAPSFPRFYGYDVLRGLTFVTAWAERTRSPIPRAAIGESVLAVESRLDGGGRVLSAGNHLLAIGTLAPDGAGGWKRIDRALSFDLLDAWGAPGRPSPFLTREWQEVESRLSRLERDGLLE